ncbi:MAG: hypothetical protein EBU90_09440 [Proteobacteria bacterium]|nr:hypothetical protein [Pseudomonadota bacterium]NBP14928.1 hypothetical protein [bacterium]
MSIKNLLLVLFLSFTNFLSCKPRPKTQGSKVYKAQFYLLPIKRNQLFEPQAPGISKKITPSPLESLVAAMQILDLSIQAQQSCSKITPS